MPTTETFSLQPDGAILRDSDGEEVATFDRDSGALSFNHPARERSYLDTVLSMLRQQGAIAALADAAAPPAPPANPNFTPPPVSVPDQPVEIPGEAPPRHPSLGAYSDAHLLYDHAHLSDDAFAAKWLPLHLSTTQSIKANPAAFGDHGAKIIARLDKLSNK